MSVQAVHVHPDNWDKLITQLAGEGYLLDSGISGQQTKVFLDGMFGLSLAFILYKNPLIDPEKAVVFDLHSPFVLTPNPVRFQ